MNNPTNILEVSPRAPEVDPNNVAIIPEIVDEPEMLYTINRLAPLTRIAGKVRDELKGPVVVLIFGVSDQNTQIMSKFCSQIGPNRFDYCMIEGFENLDMATQSLGANLVHVVDVIGELCGTAENRQRIVQTFRDANVKTVVGFYVDSSSPDQSHDWLKDVPCAEEFDYLIVAHGKNISHTLPSRQA